MTRRIPGAAAFLALAGIVLPAGCAAPNPGRPVAGSPAAGRFHAGVVVGLFSRAEPSFIRASLAEVAGLGASAVSIPIPWAVANVRSTEIRGRENLTPRDEAVRLAIREAHRLGMSVLLMPLLYVEEMEDGAWRGTIEPADWKEWFAGYGAWMIHYARLAQEEGAEILSVGSELCSSERRGEEWTALIERVREVYAGALTYSANWDHRDGIPFLDRLDYVGMNAYFELSRDGDAGHQDLLDAWRPIVEEVHRWRETAGRPLLLTEVGYPSRKGATRDPWDYTAEGEPDPEAQERAYKAFREAWAGFPSLAGVYFYLWWGEGGPRDTGYTPRGKPAEAVLRDWFRDRRRGETRWRSPG